MRLSLLHEGEKELISYIDLSKISQKTDYSCGPASLLAVVQYFRPGTDLGEDELIEIANTCSKHGTSPHNLVKAGNKLGLKMKSQRMTIDDVKKCLDNGRLVILNFQAWYPNNNYSKYDSGHYAIAIGYDNKGIVFEDPALNSHKGYLTFKELDRRWHGGTGDNKVDHYGIIVNKPTQLSDTRRVNIRPIK